MKTVDILKKLFSSFPNTQINAATVAVYVEILADIPPGDLGVIVNQCIAECKFLPTIAEIRDRWYTLTREPNQLTAAEAWGEVVLAFRQVGYVGIPQFSDERIKRVVDMIGWRTLCESENQMADRAHFIKMFDSLSERQRQHGKLLPSSRRLMEQSKANGVADLTRLISDNMKMGE